MKKPRILVVRGGAIGDFIMTLPAIGALRERWPEAHIEILGYPHIAELADKRHYADAVRSIDEGGPRPTRCSLSCRAKRCRTGCREARKLAAIYNQRA